MMHFESACNNCGGSGTKTVSMMEFADAAIRELNNTSKLHAIKAVRQLATDNNLYAGLKECKEFVDAIQAFESQLRNEA